MKKLIIITVAVLSYLITTSVNASPNSLWSDVSSSESQHQSLHRAAIEQSSLKARALYLDHDQFKKQLIQTSSFSARLSDTSEVRTFTIPLPDGGQVEVTAEENSVLSPELAKNFPDMKSWTVEGKLDTNIHGRVDFDEHGFHAMLIMPDGDTIFIDPDSGSDESNRYLSFSKSSNAERFNTGFQCDVHSNQSAINKRSASLSRVSARLAPAHITYRLAVAATGEYTQFHGGTKQSALSAIRTTINRVNEIYERDLGISFQLIAEEADIIYTDPSNDPYSNFDGSSLVVQNMVNLTSSKALSPSKYDIGHVFSTGAGGLANFEAACSGPDVLGREIKAGAATGVSNPISDAFTIDFVSHELGHQLGANHTFNSTTGNCGAGANGTPNRAGGFAVEPGSGSTVMGYAGICGVNNVQPNTDAAFHFVSIDQINNYTRTTNMEGSTCGIRTTVNNHDPVSEAGVDNIIPANTPFVLSGAGSDPNTGDNLTYSWEQNNIGTASDINIDTGNNAIIRSFLPQSSATRYIPRLGDLFQGIRLKAEKLPETDRPLNFVLTVRDGNGGVEFDELSLSVIDTGRSFQVTSHTEESNLEIGQETQVNWDVAGTNISPISCNAVDIGLIQSNGSRFDVVQQTPNDGTQIVVIPNNTLGIDGARFIIDCSDVDTTFFNISSADLRIVSQGSGSSSGGSGSSSGGSSSGSSSSSGGSFNYHLMLLLLLLIKAIRFSSRVQYKN